MTDDARMYDAVVIGAGPAGSVAAGELARRGNDVLLVDRAAFPRDKVCGCCLNGVATRTLASLGLAEMLNQLGAIPLREFRCYTPRRCVTLPLPGVTAISRATFDAALVENAVALGVAFEPETTARSGGVTAQSRTVLLQHAGTVRPVRARVVVAADGLTGSFTRSCAGIQSVVRPRSRIGVSALIDDHASLPGDEGVIVMACARGGYVGGVRLEDGRMNVAGSIDPLFIKRLGGVAKAVSEIFGQTDCQFIAEFNKSQWCGTGALTRRRSTIVDSRLFIIGDAGAYVEPFTGEGIGWALASGRLIAPIVHRAIRMWNVALAREYMSFHNQMIQRRHRRCRAICWTLRRPFVTSVAAMLLSRMPALADPFVRAINAPIRPEAVPIWP